MNIILLSWRNVQHKPMSALLNVLLVATGVFIISFVLILEKQTEEHFRKNAAGVNLVVGAKGSPLQLILSSIYQVDYPTGNILLSDAEQISRNPLVRQTIPLALGDNYKGFRIVGTNHDYPLLYHAKLREGKPWAVDFEATIGAKVAEEAGLKMGDQFAGVHGFMAESGHVHQAFKYRVTGIYEETGSVLDQVILTNIGSVWQIHAHHHHHDGEDAEHDTHSEEHESPSDEQEEAHHAEHEITALLVFYRNPMGAFTLPRQINKQTSMQAASPAIEMNRLFSLMGVGIQSANFIAYLIILISGFSIFISLFNSMKERKYELALIRVLGGRKKTIFSMVILEGLFLSFTGYVVGFILSRLGLLFISSYSESTFHYSFNDYFLVQTDAYLLCLALMVGFAASIIPALRSMSSNLSSTLSE
jgi:putative ABC transport system permease protein